jgi:hypothetical protein
MKAYTQSGGATFHEHGSDDQNSCGRPLSMGLLTKTGPAEPTSNRISQLPYSKDHALCENKVQTGNFVEVGARKSEGTHL